MPASIATVAVAAPLDKPLSYVIPDTLRESARVGMRLRVPLGRRQAVGYLLSLAGGEAEGLKPVTDVLDAEPLFPPSMVLFFERAAAYYRHPLGEVIRTALPAGLSGGKGGVKVVTERFCVPLDRPGEPPGARQREILLYLRQRGASSLSAIADEFPSPHAPLKRLAELGFVSVEERERRRDPFLDRPPGEDRAVVPTAEQEAAVASILASLDSDRFAPFLLHGVTGSGKTEVYLRAIAGALARGKRALVLVPEIALTPQLVGRFRARFEGEEKVAVLHSGLSDGERYDTWRSVARGEAAIVIGARSAVFAPLEEVGIIVVDEEHEGSYKQGDGFRYNARDLALMRGQMSGATVVLGSATPALTTFHRAREGQTGYLPLTIRVQNRPMPQVELVDLSAERPEGALSAPLAAALAENLQKGEQSVLLLNRRGFAPYLLCADCGCTFRCPNCEITLTFYHGRRRLLCHYCDYAEPPPETCPGCGGGRIEPEGVGTERLEEELAALLPGARLARMDRDTTARKGAHEELVARVARGEVDILFGTQMIAKGHDFPAVTLVGVVNADHTLNFPDFRSAERTFALLAQVAGRAGRGERPGRVLVQTWSPAHYALQCVVGHDYESFYQQEIAFRRELGYPPFGHLANLVFSGLDAEKVLRAATILAAALPAAAGVEVLGPAPCPLARLRGKSRVQLLLKGEQRSALHRILCRIDGLRRQLPSGVSLGLDVDPLDML
jgi:primosomal protein N' (replication factor Y)